MLPELTRDGRSFQRSSLTKMPMMPTTSSIIASETSWRALPKRLRPRQRRRHSLRRPPKTKKMRMIVNLVIQKVMMKEQEHQQSRTLRSSLSKLILSQSNLLQGREITSKVRSHLNHRKSSNLKSIKIQLEPFHSKSLKHHSMRHGINTPFPKEKPRRQERDMRSSERKQDFSKRHHLQMLRIEPDQE